MVASRYAPARIALGLFLAAALGACGGDSSAPATQTADVQFALGDGDSRLASALAAAADPNPPAAVVLSIETQAGEVVHDMLRLDVYAFGPTHVSQRVQLPVGRYRLTRFLVVDAQNETIYAAPNADGSGVDPELVGAVETPLPIPFNVVPGVLHSQAVEVLPVAARSPQQFGYAAFTFRIDEGPETATRVHYGPGWDGVFFTEDDEVAGYSYVEFTEAGHSLTDRWFALGTTTDGRGPDQLWFTEDDVPMGWWWQHDDEQYGTNHSGPGADGIWVSDDDPITSWEEFASAYDPWDGSVLNGLYTDAGPDGTWRTPDDVLGGYLKRVLHPNGAEAQRIRYVSPGWDGVWYTPDDQIGQDWFGAYVVNTYPAGHTQWGSWSRQVSYSDPGWDYEWLTADDVPSRCLRHEFGDGTEYWTREIVTTPGWDETCFTTDDSVIGYSRATNVY
ncbi:MAG TPA: hypothetical protein VEB43_21735 [Anaeromyxobacter sp.]|nr:hypothetical protein [Anaeromyxobacter sp.]